MNLRKLFFSTRPNQLKMDARPDAIQRLIGEEETMKYLLTITKPFKDIPVQTDVI